MRVRDTERARADTDLSGRKIVVIRRPRKGPGGEVCGSIFLCGSIDNIERAELSADDKPMGDETAREACRWFDKLGGTSPMAGKARLRAGTP